MPDTNPPPPPDTGAGIPSPPDSTPYGSPTINVTATDYQDPPRPKPNDFWASQAAEETYYTAYWFLVDHHVPRWIAWLLGGVLGLLVGILAYVIAAGFWTLTRIGQPFAEFVVGTMSEARRQMDPRLPLLAADILGELTGADIQAGDFPTGKGFAGHLGRVQSIGNQLHTLLEEEFAPNGKIGADQGAQAAKAFTGFNINFGIGTAIMSLLGEIETLGKVEQFRELGVEVARNLGLGRLSRMALQPLIKTMIADPYTWHLHNKYRPTRFNEPLLIKMLFRGAISNDVFRHEMAELGYSDERIDQHITEQRPLLNERQIVDLYFRFNNPLDATKAALQQHGWQIDESQLLIDLFRPALKELEIIMLYLHGAMDKPTATQFLAKLGYDSATTDLLLQAHQINHQRTHTIPFLELKRLLAENQIDVIEFQDRLRKQGWADDDITLLTADAIFQRPGKPHHLTIGILKAAYKLGTLQEVEAIGELEKLGYTKDDAIFIVSTFAKPKPPTPATPAAGG